MPWGCQLESPWAHTTLPPVKQGADVRGGSAASGAGGIARDLDHAAEQSQRVPGTVPGTSDRADEAGEDQPEEAGGFGFVEPAEVGAAVGAERVGPGEAGEPGDFERRLAVAAAGGFAEAGDLVLEA